MEKIRADILSHGGLTAGVKRIAALIAMGALFILGLGAATLLALSALAAGAVLLTVGAVISLIAYLRRGRGKTGDDDILVARKGPTGWTVDTAGKFSL